MPIDLSFDPSEIPLLTDLYELTMAASFFAQGFNRPACFGISVRRLPARRGFLVAAGLERLLEALEQFRFKPVIINYLASLKLFTSDFLDFLGNLRFTGNIYAMAEGSIFFCGRAHYRSARSANRGTAARDSGDQPNWNGLAYRD